MPKKIRELKSMLRKAGWVPDPSGGTGIHSTWTHASIPGKLTLSGQDGNDARRYQEKDVKNAIREAEKGQGDQR